MQDNSALGRAMAMVRDLRNRCPWDRAQTRETLRPYLVEEVLELDHALGEGDRARSAVSSATCCCTWPSSWSSPKSGASSPPTQVADELEAKMRRRHPHLFDLGDAEPGSGSSGASGTGSPGGPDADPAPLLMAYRLQERAASVGFDWPDVQGPLDKIREELAEVEAELAAPETQPPGPLADPNMPGRAPSEALVDEIGDLLFAVVNLARKAGVQPGPALDRANRKFRQRFEADRAARRASAGSTWNGRTGALDGLG